MQIQQIVRFHELIKHIYYATLQLFYVLQRTVIHIFIYL